MVVMKAESFDIDGFVERPGICSVFLWQHLSDQPWTEAQMWDCCFSFQTASEMMLRVGLWCFSLGLLERPNALPPWPSVSRDRRRRTKLVIRSGGGSVCFSLLALSRLFEGRRSDVKKKQNKWTNLQTDWSWKTLATGAGRYDWKFYISFYFPIWYTLRYN